MATHSAIADGARLFRPAGRCDLAHGNGSRACPPAAAFTNVPTKVSVRWIMRRDQYAIFEGWYRWQARKGQTGSPSHCWAGWDCWIRKPVFTRQFSARLLAGGTLWEITSELEIRERPVLDEGLLNLLLSEDPAGLIFSGNSLHILVHQTLPITLN